MLFFFFFFHDFIFRVCIAVATTRGVVPRFVQRFVAYPPYYTRLAGFLRNEDLAPVSCTERTTCYIDVVVVPTHISYPRVVGSRVYSFEFSAPFRKFRRVATLRTKKLDASSNRFRKFKKNNGYRFRGFSDRHYCFTVMG